MKFHGSGRQSIGYLRATFQASSAATTEDFIIDQDATRICLITFPHAIHAGIHTCPTMEAVLFVNHHTIPREGLALFSDLLIETRSDHVEEPVELRTIFHFLDKLCDLLNREINVVREIFFQVFEKLAMLKVDLTFLVAATAVETEVKRQDF
jgi:hypothetical protein